MAAGNPFLERGELVLQRGRGNTKPPDAFGHGCLGNTEGNWMAAGNPTRTETQNNFDFVEAGLLE
jgi:hypothetical protein